MKCRKCNQELALIEADGIRYRECPGCFGRMVGNLDLKKVIRSSAVATDSQAEEIVDLAALITESDSKEELRCPRCLAPMSKGRLHQLVPVVVDTCDKCQMTWLDAGEQRLIIRLYQEMQNSDDPKVMAMREKLAQLNLKSQRDGSALDYLWGSQGAANLPGDFFSLF